MKFTFGIITSNKVDQRILDSIHNQLIKDYEIIVVGGENVYDNVIHIPFDDTIKPGWITKKKNIITNHAKYENIVFMHDYICLNKNWYKGFKKFGNEWDICMNIIYNSDGSRFRDWIAYDDPNINWPGKGYPNIHGNSGHRMILPSYNYNKFQYMTISGTYWVVKKHVMQQQPLDETLLWAQGEDAEWSKRVLTKYEYRMNTLSSVHTLKAKTLSADYLDI